MDFGKIAVCFMFLASLASFGFAEDPALCGEVPQPNIITHNHGMSLGEFLDIGQGYSVSLDSIRTIFGEQYPDAVPRISIWKNGQPVDSFLIGSFDSAFSATFEDQYQQSLRVVAKTVELPEGSISFLAKNVTNNAACIMILPSSQWEQNVWCSTSATPVQVGGTMPVEGSNAYQVRLSNSYKTYTSLRNMACWIFGSSQTTYAADVSILRNNEDVTSQYFGSNGLMILPQAGAPIALASNEDAGAHLLVQVCGATPDNAWLRTKYLPACSPDYTEMNVGDSIGIPNAEGYSISLEDVASRLGPDEHYAAILNIAANGSIVGQVQVDSNQTYTFASPDNFAFRINVCKVLPAGINSAKKAWVKPTLHLYLGCVDTDGGINQFVRGQATRIYTDGNVPYYPQYNDTDTCFDSQLSEFYCDQNGSVRKTIITCQNGCVDGACVQAVAPLPIKPLPVVEKPVPAKVIKPAELPTRKTKQ